MIDSSPVTVASFNKALDDVLSWLDEANDTVTKQSPVASDIESLKEQFHYHEVCFLFYLFCLICLLLASVDFVVFFYGVI